MSTYSMKGYSKTFLMALSILALMGCSTPFKPVNIDPATGQFPTSAEVDQKYIKIFRPLPGVRNMNYVFLQAYTPHGNDRFYEFMKDSLLKIGFKKVYGDRELSQMVIQSGLSKYVTNISDLISLNNLYRAAGPFVYLQSRVYLVSNAVFRFDLQLIDPLSGKTCLEISRVRTNWLDMDTEINYPILNVIRQWYEESAKIPYEKPAVKEVL